MLFQVRLIYFSLPLFLGCSPLWFQLKSLEYLPRPFFLGRFWIPVFVFPAQWDSCRSQATAFCSACMLCCQLVTPSRKRKAHFNNKFSLCYGSLSPQVPAVSPALWWLHTDFFKNRLYFIKLFLGSQQNWAETTEFPYPLCFHTLLTCLIPHHSGKFVLIDEPSLISSLSPIVHTHSYFFFVCVLSSLWEK